MATDPNMIKNFSCFHDLSEDQLQTIAEISNSVCYSSGHVLFEEGEQGKYLYLLIDGDVEVFFKADETGFNKVDTISSEEMAGCSAMVPPYIYTATETALSEVEVLEININDLRDLIEKDPGLGIKLQQYMIQTLNDRILKLRQKPFSM
jgi:CRP/FNR family transcriptional regulator, cyclic AMP receptor protein